MPVIFGEVLFDEFPDGSSVLGGAPFNVAWHLSALGADPLLVSRVGDDAAGREVLRAMEARGMETGGIQVDPERPTGAVRVTIESGEPRFEILADQAYDRIDAAAARAALAGARTALTYHGTLALRAPANARALDELLSRRRGEATAGAGAGSFMDVNLRDPWWRGEDLPALAERARWVKLNAAELGHIARELGHESLVSAGSRLRGASKVAGESVCELRRRLDLDLLVVTLGGEGALAVDATDQVTEVAPRSGIEVIDTVGAGDALASVAILGLLRGWPVADTLDRAQLLASRICGIRGATTDDRSIYEGVI